MILDLHRSIFRFICFILTYFFKNREDNNLQNKPCNNLKNFDKLCRKIRDICTRFVFLFCILLFVDSQHKTLGEIPKETEMKGLSHNDC